MMAFYIAETCSCWLQKICCVRRLHPIYWFSGKEIILIDLRLKEAPTTPTVSHVVGPDNQENTANNSNISSEGSLKVAKPSPPSSSKTSHPRVATSHF
jgi:hypothetical protein